MTDWKRREKRKTEVRCRAEQPNHMYGYCRVIGCGKPARAGTADGLDEKFCRSHAEYLQRHGSPYKASYRATEIAPYRRSALEWLMGHEEDFWASNAIQRIRGLYDRSGPHVEAFRLRGMSPQERARAAWARLRHHGVDLRLPVAAWLAVEMIVRDDPQPVLTSEFKRVQGAKIVHRMASGSHKRWEREERDPHDPFRTRRRFTELHVYPRSRGRVLRHIGEDLASAVELLVDHHLGTIGDHMRNSYGASCFGTRATPRVIATRRRTAHS